MTIPGAQATALDFIKAALRNLNVLAPGEDPTGPEAQDCLVVLNQMLDSWSADGLTIFSINIEDFPLQASKQVYTYGPGGDFNSVRPAAIERASIVMSPAGAQPIEYPMPVYTSQDWQEMVPVKNTTGNLPLLIYDDGDFPLRNITFWPNATDNVVVRFYREQKLTQFTKLNQVAAYPPGYMEAITNNLAVRLGGLFPPAQASATTALLAIQTLAQIKINNADDTKLRSDIMGQGSGSRMRAEMFGIPTI